MKKLSCDLINILGFEALQPSDDTDWEIDQLLSQVPDPAIICLQIPYIPEPPECSLPAPASTWSLEPTPSSRFTKPFSEKEIQNSGSAPSLQTLKRAPPLLSMYGKSGVHAEEDEPE